MRDEYVGAARQQALSPTPAHDCLQGMTIVNANVAPVGPTSPFQALAKCRYAGLHIGVVLRKRYEYADAPHTLARLLRTRRQRPRRRAA